MLISSRYEEAVLYEELPISWKSSFAFFSIVIRPYITLLALGFGVSLLTVLDIKRPKHSTLFYLVAYLICLSSNIFSIGYLVFSDRKYNSVLYLLKEPIVNDFGKYVTVLNTMSIPIILSIIGTIVLIIGLISLRRGRVNNDY